MHVKDKTFVITGGASGLGFATAQDLYQHGGWIAILDQNADSGAEAVSAIGKDRCKFFEVDVTDSDAIGAAIKGVTEWIGQTGKSVGGVVSAAGVAMPGKLIDRKNNPVSMSAIDFVLNINLRGTIDFVRQSLPLMAKLDAQGEDGERGVIILVSSSAAFDGQPGQVAYSASKGAVRSMTLPLARDLAPLGIRVVTIAPSLFETRMASGMQDKVRQSLQRTLEFPKRFGKAEEFASLVRHAVENAYLNGEVIRLDGGMRMPSRM